MSTVLFGAFGCATDPPPDKDTGAVSGEDAGMSETPNDAGTGEGSDGNGQMDAEPSEDPVDTGTEEGEDAENGGGSDDAGSGGAGEDAGGSEDAVSDAGEGGDGEADNSRDVGSDTGDDDPTPVEPGSGDVVVTEYMADPDALSDKKGEWFEFYNPSSSTTYELEGCVIRDNGEDSETIGSSLTVGPGEYVTLARSDSPGFGSPDYVYGTWYLGNGDDEIVLECSDVVDEVAYSGTEAPTGASMGLDPTKLDATSNDDTSNWCEQTSDQGNGDKGTPGEKNDGCGD